MKPSHPVGAACWVAVMLAVLWAIAIVNALLDHRLLRFGIKPRQVDGLAGIVISPFLHADVGQLAANTVPFVVLGWLMLVSGVRTLVLLSVAVALVAGAVDWTLGPANAVILGVSGVLFGWFGYLLARAWYSRNVKFVAVAILVIAIFSSMLTGLLPHVNSHVFWGGHLAALVVGIAIAALLHRRPAAKKPAAATG